MYFLPVSAVAVEVPLADAAVTLTGDGVADLRTIVKYTERRYGERTET